VTYQFGAR